MKTIYRRYYQQKALAAVTEEEIINGFIDIRYDSRYFNTDDVNPIDIWSKLVKINKSDWHGVLLLSELCLCAPFSNASLERFFSHMNIVKIDIRSKLSSKSFNSMLRIRMTNLSLNDFNSPYIDDWVNDWNSNKQRRINQKQRKHYKEQHGN